MQCDRLTNAEIEQDIQQTAAALKAERQYVAFLAQGRGFPPDPLVRNHMIESHQKMIANYGGPACCSRQASDGIKQLVPITGRTPTLVAAAGACADALLGILRLQHS